MPSAGGGGAPAGGGGDDPTTADEATTFTYTTRTGLKLVLHQSRRSFNCGTTLWSAGEVLARCVRASVSCIRKWLAPVA